MSGPEEMVIANPVPDWVRLLYACHLPPDDPRRRFVELQVRHTQVVERYNSPAFALLDTRGIDVWKGRRPLISDSEWRKRRDRRDEGERVIEPEMEDLVRAHGHRWDALIPRSPGDFDERFSPSRRFQRGFVESAGMKAAELPDRFEECAGNAPLLRLYVNEARGKLARLAEVPLLRQIRWLSVGDERDELTDHDVIDLVESPYVENLVYLSLNVDDGREALEALAWSPHLKKLDLLELEAGRTTLPGEFYEEDYGDYNEIWKIGTIVPGTTYLSIRGRELEERYGYKKWLHGPTRYGERYKWHSPRFLYDDEMVEPPPAEVRDLLIANGYADLLAPDPSDAAGS